MRTILLRVAYDGTDYSGFQIQKDHPTIEEALTNAILKILGENVTLTGGGRTDAGVHSMGNAVVFSTESKIPVERLPMALNTALPEDIRVLFAEEVPEGFHPRKCHSVKTYEYRIENGRIPTPLYRRESYFFHVPLNVEEMQKAAAFLVGEHDFSSFCSAGSAAEDFIRRVYSLEVLAEDGQERHLILPENRMITIRISGNGFLYNMVRIIVGTLLEVGTGRIRAEQVREILEARDRRAAGRKVPACGLMQLGIRFCEEEYPQVVENDDWSYTLTTEGEELTITFKSLKRREDGQVLIGKLAAHAFRDGKKKVFLKLEPSAKEVIFPEGEAGSEGAYRIGRFEAVRISEETSDFSLISPENPLDTGFFV